MLHQHHFAHEMTGAVPVGRHRVGDRDGEVVRVCLPAQKAKRQLTLPPAHTLLGLRSHLQTTMIPSQAFFFMPAKTADLGPLRKVHLRMLCMNCLHTILQQS